MVQWTAIRVTQEQRDRLAELAKTPSQAIELLLSPEEVLPTTTDQLFIKIEKQSKLIEELMEFKAKIEEKMSGSYY